MQERTWHSPLSFHLCHYLCFSLVLGMFLFDKEGINYGIYFWAAHGVAWGKSFLGVFLFLNGSLTFTAKYQKQGEERNKWGNSFLKGGRKSCYSCSLTRIFLDVRGNSLTKAGRYRQARWQWRAWDSPEGVWAMSSLSRDLVILPQGGFFFMSISVPFFQYREL